MGKVIEGDDGLLAEKVGPWAKEKQDFLCKYVDISRGTRAKYLPPKGRGGACYIDLFCGPGRSYIENTHEWIDGSPVAAWKKSVEGGAPFSKVIIGDADETRLRAAETRLRSLGADVVALHGKACDTVLPALQKSDLYGLNFAFLDPYSIGALDFQVFSTLARLKRIDILVHISKMDMQRNTPLYIDQEQEKSSFDSFAPGWRETIYTDQNHTNVRREVFDYWRDLVAGTNIAPSEDIRLITGTHGQHLYWLLLAAKHDLAHRFWKSSSEGNQKTLF